MSKVCDICGKHTVAGRSISHSHRTVNRKFKPNIQRVTDEFNIESSPAGTTLSLVFRSPV